MISELYSELRKLFAEKRTLVGGDEDASTFRELASAQRENYQRLHSTFSNIDYNGGSVDVRQIVDPFFGAIISSLANNTPQPGKYGKETILYARAPVIRDSEISKFIDFVIEKLKPQTQSDAIDLAWSVVAAIIVELDHSIIFNAPNINSSIYLIANKYIFLYIYEKNKTIIETESINNFQSQLEKTSEQYKSVKNIIQELNANVENLRAKSENSITDILNKLNDSHSLIENSKQRIVDFENSTIESLRLNKARILWHNRHKSAMIGFWISSLIILITLICVPLFLIYEYNFVIKYISGIINVLPIDQHANNSSMSMNDSTEWTAIISLTSRIFLISFPLLMYIWFIRIVVKFFMRSVTVMDDSRQREVMLDTFLNLIEIGRAEDKDRLLILEAIFRPLPGHGSDGMEPPNIVDFINARSS